jgi:hypothetical protein
VTGKKTSTVGSICESDLERWNQLWVSKECWKDNFTQRYDINTHKYSLALNLNIETPLFGSTFAFNCLIVVKWCSHFFTSHIM